MPSPSKQSPSAQDIWKWTLTREAIAPCFVRDVLAMRESGSIGADFFWLGYTPCRSVVLVGMVVAVQVYDKRTLYTIDDGTAVVDCVLRHPTPPKSKPATVSSPATASKKSQRPSPKKARIERDNQVTTPGPPGPPPPITEPGYSVRVVGKVVKHYDSRQVLAEWIEPCPSSLDEMAHWRRVIELHKTKYSLAIPFVLPSPQAATTSDPPADSSMLQGDACVFISKASIAGPGSGNGGYKLPAARLPLQSRPVSTSDAPYISVDRGHIPTSPTTASSTPSSPCKNSSPVKGPELDEPPLKPKLRHPSRLHTRDLTANTFRLYMKHYMDNAPPPLSFPLVNRSHVQSEDESDDEGVVKTPTKRSRHHENRDRGGRTPRPLINTGAGLPRSESPTLGFTLSHLRRVPELALLAARVVRAETRKREKVQREHERQKARRDGVVSHRTKPPASMTSQTKLTTSPSEDDKGRPSASTSSSMPTPSLTAAPDPPHKKMKRLFAWAVVKLYEEGSIVLWDGDVRPLPLPVLPAPSLALAGGGETSTLWKTVDSTIGDNTIRSSASTFVSYSTLHPYSASASHHSSRETEADTDSSYLSDPQPNEEAYVPLTPRFLAGYVQVAVAAMVKGNARGAGGRVARGNAARSGSGLRLNADADSSSYPSATPEDIAAYLRRTDARWARLGAWAVEEALEVLNGGH
ncbi:hypothetical protein BDN67DRAFT_965786 [Paxillus ammoniavirescens]|nr:hypothetical protein BDN67DRAFT_965786 [Paxillus ammoniavirescens]